MKFYRIAGDPQDFGGDGTPYSADLVATPNPAEYDATRVRGSVGTMYAQAATLVAPTPIPLDNEQGVWIHVRRYDMSASLSYYDEMEHTFTVYDSAGDALVITPTHNDGGFTLELTGNAGTVVRSAYGVHGGHLCNPPADIDVHLYTDASGSGRVEYYKDGALLVYSMTPSEPLNDFSSAVFGCGRWEADMSTHLSEGILCDYDTRGMRVKTFYPTADGTYTDAGVDAFALVDDMDPGADQIALAAGGVHSFTLSGVGDDTVPGVLGMAACVHGGAAAGYDLVLGVRAGGVDYYAPALGLTEVPLPRQTVWSMDVASGVVLPQSMTSMELILKAE